MQAAAIVLPLFRCHIFIGGDLDFKTGFSDINLAAINPVEKCQLAFSIGLAGLHRCRLDASRPFQCRSGKTNTAGNDAFEKFAILLRINKAFKKTAAALCIACFFFLALTLGRVALHFFGNEINPAHAGNFFKLLHLGHSNGWLRLGDFNGIGLIFEGGKEI